VRISHDIIYEVSGASVRGLGLKHKMDKAQYCTS